MNTPSSVYVNIVGYNDTTKKLEENGSGLYEYTKDFSNKGYVMYKNKNTVVTKNDCISDNENCTIYFLDELAKLTITHGQKIINYTMHDGNCFERSLDNISMNPFHLDIMLSTGEDTPNCIRLYTSSKKEHTPSSCQPDPLNDSPCNPLPDNCKDPSSCCKALSGESYCNNNKCVYVSDSIKHNGLISKNKLEQVKCGLSPPSPSPKPSPKPPPKPSPKPPPKPPPKPGSTNNISSRTIILIVGISLILLLFIYFFIYDIFSSKKRK